MAISDTSPEAREIQLQIHRSMSGEQRILIALEMSLFGRELMRERIRSQHPEWDESQVQREIWRIAFLPSPLPAGLR
jgi:Rv0078B-related antitoxin